MSEDICQGVCKNRSTKKGAAFWDHVEAAAEQFKQSLARDVVVTKMLDEYHSIIGTVRQRMAAALAVAREGCVSLDDVLGPVNDDDRKAWLRTPLTSSPSLTMRSERDADIILANRRARLAKPAERERVTVHGGNVYLDGKWQIAFQLDRDANIYAAGLREKVKAGKR